MNAWSQHETHPASVYDLEQGLHNRPCVRLVVGGSKLNARGTCNQLRHESECLCIFLMTRGKQSGLCDIGGIEPSKGKG